MKKFIGLPLALITLITLILWWQTPGTSTASPVTSNAPAARQQGSTPPPATPAKTTPITTKVNLTERVEIAMQQQFAEVATAYAAELAYPPYSRPLTKADVQLLHPNHYVVQPIPLQDGASAAIVLPQYRFIYPDTISARLAITGLVASQVELSLIAEETGKLLAQQPMLAKDKDFTAELSASKDWQGPLKLQVRFRANGEQMQLHTGIEYQQPVAFITGVADAYAEGADLVIPLKLRVDQAGTYRIRANLFSAQGLPLAHLVSSARLNSGNVSLPLRAYKAVLAEVDGPYLLNTFIVELRSPAPGTPGRYGYSEQAEYAVPFYGLEQLSDEPWQPEQSELMRLQFLNQLAGAHQQ